MRKHTDIFEEKEYGVEKIEFFEENLKALPYGEKKAWEINPKLLFALHQLEEYLGTKCEDWVLPILYDVAKINGGNIAYQSVEEIMALLIKPIDCVSSFHIGLLDLLEYLKSSKRKALLNAIAFDEGYFIERIEKSIKFSFLGQLELAYTNCNNELIKWHVSPASLDIADNDEIVLLERPIKQFLEDSTDPIVEYVKNMFKNESFCEIKFFGTSMNPYNKPKRELKRKKPKFF